MKTPNIGKIRNEFMHCCELMQYWAEHRCNDRPDPIECPDLDLFRERYLSGFSKPKLQENRIWQLYVDLEIIADGLAGPLSAIVQRGNCDYVYRDKEGRFPGVTSADTFRKWALDLAEEYKKGIEAFTPKNKSEEEEQRKLLKKAEEMAKLVELAYEIQKSREQKL